jgi:hypothetical protein
MIEFQQPQPHPEEIRAANTELSQQYALFKEVDGIEPALVNHNARTISNCDVDIRKYFEENGSLDGLKCLGIGKKIKSDLTTVLKNGVEKARADKERAREVGTDVNNAVDIDLRNFQITLKREERRLAEE